MEDYIIVPRQKPFPKMIDAYKEFDDEAWKNYILSFLLQYCKDVDKNQVAKIIETEKNNKQSKVEEVLKKHIRKWFINNIRFCEYGFIINRESHVEGEQEGFYDLKFQHSFWDNNKKYFAFECKNLDNPMDTCVSGYVYKSSKDKDDGGVFRFIIKKYAPDLDFGGMIGFLIYGKLENAIDKILEKLENLDLTDKHIGKIMSPGIVKNSIAGNKNTFQSNHICYNSTTKQYSSILLYHIIIDFQIR